MSGISKLTRILKKAPWGVIIWLNRKCLHRLALFRKAQVFLASEKFPSGISLILFFLIRYFRDRRWIVYPYPLIKQIHSGRMGAPFHSASPRSVSYTHLT